MTEEVGPGREAVVSLREVTKDTVRAICRLKVAPHQEHFVAPNAVSIAQAYFEPKAWFRAVYANETPVGFVMLEEDTEKEEYFLWRYMVDTRYQKLGYGRQALTQVIEHVKTRPGATGLYTSCVPGDGSPCPFYERMGFRYTGEMDDDELVMRLDF
jgi:diamine N-acetyltransferase